MRKTESRPSLTLGLVVASLAGILCSAAAPPQRERPARPTMRLPAPPIANEAGFAPIFDGKTMNGWKGDPVYWRVENGSLVGEVTPDTLLKANSFIVWQGGDISDFELKMEYRISDNGNSGVNYRSVQLSSPAWAMSGYQFDLDGPAWGKTFAEYLARVGVKVPDADRPGEMESPGPAFRVSGQIYEERGRDILALPGHFSRMRPGEPQRVETFIGQPAAAAGEGGWNRIHIIAKGNLLIHVLNGHVVAMLLDEDGANARPAGKLGMQAHVGPPMKVEFRNIRLKRS